MSRGGGVMAARGFHHRLLGVSRLPGLRPIPWLGSALALPRLFRDPVRLLPRLYREHGALVAIERGDPPLVCAFGPAFNQLLLPRSRDFEHYADVPLRVPPGSALERSQSNLTTSNGDLHRRHRRLMMPAFGKPVVQSHCDDVVALGERHLSRWRPGTTVDVAQQMLELSLTVMMKGLFGLDAGDGAAELGGLSTQLLEHMISPAAALLPIDLPATPYRRLLRLSERLEARLLGMIRERRASSHEGRDVLSLLLRAHDDDGARFSDVELLGNMGLLFVAGHETTAFALTWTLLLLAQHPGVLGSVREELRERLHGEAPRADQLTQLPRLDAVIKESLRLLPPTYMLFVRRGATAFDLGGVRMPAGSMVVLSPLVTHHMESIYPKPERFRPARWEGRKPSIFEFLPFGAGPRLCLGASFAEQVLRSTLAMIVQRFDLRTIDGTRVRPRARGITMGPRGGLPMRIYAAGRAPRRPAALGGGIEGLVRW